MVIVASLVCGLLFGAGLLISGMLQPDKVLGFLDIFGAWDPSLAVVMATALAVAIPGFVLLKRRARPLLAERYQMPTATRIDARLATGAALFGVGWGLAGLCPGPALENLVTLSPGVIGFVAAMVAGMRLHDLWRDRRAGGAPAARRK